jgi:hypothetical integral membrane protein (TIGR02206 family)
LFVQGNFHHLTLRSATPNAFIAWDTLHWATLLVVFACAAALICKTRSTDQRLRRCEWILAAILLLNFPASLPIMQQAGLQTADNSLPLHLCDITALCAGFALLCQRPLLVELTWFWGMAGAGNSILTPTAKYAFPHPENLWFFAMHGGIVIAAAYLVIGRKLWPRKGAVLWTLALGNIYLLCVGIINWQLGTNYGYACHKPDTPTLLDVLGPWPWYLIALQVVALLLFLALDAPFWRVRKSKIELENEGGFSS